MKPQNDNIDMFLDMQEHPDKYTDSQIESMLENIDRLPDVEAEWTRFSAEHLDVGRKSTPKRFLRIVAAAACVALIVGVGLRFFTGTSENGECVAYIGGERIIDEDEVMKMVHASMTEMAQPDDIIDNQLNDIFKDI